MQGIKAQDAVTITRLFYLATFRQLYLAIDFFIQRDII